MKILKFVRWGNLSTVHKQFYKKDTFHSPPCKRGVYVFHPKFIEQFLVAWKWYKQIESDDPDYELEDEKFHIRQKQIKYSGKVWTHLYYPNQKGIVYYKHNKGWYETDTDCIELLIGLEVKKMNKDVNSDPYLTYGKQLIQKNAHRYCSKDHMEFFIEKIK